MFAPVSNRILLIWVLMISEFRLAMASGGEFILAPRLLLNSQLKSVFLGLEFDMIC